VTDLQSNSHHGIWIFAEQASGDPRRGSAGRIQRVSHELLTRARKLADTRGTDLSAFVLGHRIPEPDLLELIHRGADRVVFMQAPELEHFLVEPYAACLLHLMDEFRPEVLLAGATTAGRTLMPYVAAKANAGLTADCTHLDIEPDTGNLLQTRPAIGGNILATIKTQRHRPQMATVRPRSARPAEKDLSRTGEIIRLDPSPGALASRIRRTGFIPEEGSHPLQDADIVVSVGRGIKKAENVPVVEPLVRALGAALGASRDVVDRGWLSYPHQVGLSGKTVSPRLYLALGISGSIQHLAGMQTSDTIVAVNSDPDAQIFRVADLGIVGDLFEVVPAIVDRLNRREPQQ